MARRRPKSRVASWIGKSAQNALEIARLGRLEPAEPLPFQEVDRTRDCRLRRYRVVDASSRSAPLVLIPPLMLTAEIYDVAPDISAVRALCERGIDPWVVDFGAPEREEGGMDRTLDDHVRAVVWAVERAAEIGGRAVHLAGYSQGGMFAYQAGALRRSDGIASIVTFGSPVDIHANLPNVASDVAGQLIRGVSPMLDAGLSRIQGLPGKLSSTGFKLLTPKKEVEQLIDFVKKLHDRQALEKRATRRRFLGGEGFVAWPGPALRKFFEDFIVHNRMVSGGFVIDGKTASLADITGPILYFVGNRDDFARPSSVRAIATAAPHASCFEIDLKAGHFGLVVGSTALTETWPAVIEWVRWRDGDGPKPRALVRREPETPWHDEPEELVELELDYELIGGEIFGAIGSALSRASDLVRDAGHTVDNLRWQLPRLTRLERMTGRTLVSASLTLAEQARTIPDQTFFLWRDRAFSYRDADARVGHVAAGLLACGVKPADRVGVLMGGRPSYLSMVTALNRIGAVAVLVDPSLDDEALARAMKVEPLFALACDPEHADRARVAFDGHVLVLGGGTGRRTAPGAIDMEAIDLDATRRPSWYRPDAGRARELAMVLVRPGRAGDLKVARVSNGRWAFSALGVASAATLTPRDTVYSCLPLHHPTGILVSVGGALVGGSRLALSAGFDPGGFWPEVRRAGATVVFYAGEMARPLLDAPPSPSEQSHPVRLFAGSGMRGDVWRRLSERFGVGVLELYASTERNLVLANASGEKVGSLGRPLPGSAEIALARYDFELGDLVERRGRLFRADADVPGIALARAKAGAQGPGLRHDVFEDGDRWFVTDDVLRRDRDGDYWFVDRLANMVRTPSGLVATPAIEDALHQLPEIALAVVYGEPDGTGGREHPVAAVVSSSPLDPKRIGRACGELEPHQRPRWVRRVGHIPMTEGFVPIKAMLRDGGAEQVLEALRYDEAQARYVL